MRRIHVLGFVISLLAIVGWNIYERTDLRREIEKTRRGYVQRAEAAASGPFVSQQLGPLREVTVPPAAVPAAPAASVGNDPAPTLEQAEAPPTDEERAIGLQNSFDAEPYDPAWASDARHAVEDSLRERAGTSAIRDVSCKSIFCRVQIVHHDFQGQSEFARQMTSLERRFWKGEMFLQPPEEGPNGESTSTIFLLRPGAHAPTE